MKFELLPNEIFIECFQYLNAPDIFNSFDQLNYRFYSLIRNSSLHLNFQGIKKSKFNEFCEIILLNPEIKHNFISLRLSNKGIPGQIESFFSLFPLNQFIYLRSLSLIGIRDDNNFQQLLSMLPLLFNLYEFSYIPLESTRLEITPVLLKSNIPVLEVPRIRINSTSIYETMAVTTLAICYGDLSDLCKLLKYMPMLKYLKIKSFDDSPNTNNELDFTNTNAIYLKQLILDSYTVKFKNLELLLKCTPNLKIFSVFRQNDMEMLDANRWQRLIECSLLHLHVFRFCFGYFLRTSYDKNLIKFQQFQTDFWHKQHHWYTKYEIDHCSASIYTIPYVRSK